jgi:hypothetical protein
MLAKHEQEDTKELAGGGCQECGWLACLPRWFVLSASSRAVPPVPVRGPPGVAQR